MDKDISDLGVKFGAQERLLKALRETQSDHTARLTRLETGVQRLDARVERLEAGMQTVQAGVQTIIGLLDRETDRDGESGDS